MSDTMPSDVIERFRKELESLPTTSPDGEQLPKEAVVEAAAPIIEKIPTTISASDLEAVAMLFKAIIGIGATVIKRSVSERRAREKARESEQQKAQRESARREQASKVPARAIHLTDNSTETKSYLVTPAAEGSNTADMWSLDVEDPKAQLTRVRDLPQPVAQVLFEAERRALVISPDDVALVISADDLERGSWLRKCGSRGASNRLHGDLLKEAFERLKDQTPVISPEPRISDTGHVTIPPRGVQPYGWQDKAPGITEDEAIDRWSEWARIAQDQPGGILAHLAGVAVDSYYVGVMRRQPHAVDVFGRDLHTGKSTGTFCLSAMIGNPDKTCIAMDVASPVSVSTLVGLVGTGLATFDESQLFRATAEDRALTTFRLAQGGQRLRARSDGSGITRGLQFSGIGLFNGNMRFVDDETMDAVYPGLSRRYFAFPVDSNTPVTEGKVIATRLKDLALEAYGYLIPRVLSRVPVAMYAKILESQLEFVTQEYPGADSEVQSVLAGHLAGAAALDHVLGSDLLSAARAHVHAYLNGGSVYRAMPIETLFLTKVRAHIASNLDNWPLYRDYAIHIRPDLAKAANEYTDGTVRDPIRGFRNADGSSFCVASHTQLVQLCEELGIADPDAVVDGLDKKSKLLSVADSERKHGTRLSTVTLASLNGNRVRARAYVLKAPWQEDTSEGQEDDPKKDQGDVDPDPKDPAPVDPAPAHLDPLPAEEATFEEESLPCAVCGVPTPRRVNGIPNHVRGVCTPGPAPVIPHQTTTEEAAVRPAPADTVKGKTPARTIAQNVAAAMEKAGGDQAAATVALVKRAIPDAMEILRETRVSGRYDVVQYPPMPDIFAVRAKGKADQIWEGRQNWTNKTVPAGTEVDRLDMNAAFLSAMNTHLPLGALEYQESPEFDRRRSGAYLITPPEWSHTGLPNPLGNRETPGELWVMRPTLQGLVDASTPKYGSLCAPPVIHASWTSGSTENLLRGFRDTLRDARDLGIETDDEVTEKYVKAMYSKFTSTMSAESSANRELKRSDWRHIIRAQAFANLWRRSLKAHQAGLTVYRASGTDELHVIGDWRSVWAEGRGLAEMKLKTEDDGTGGTYRVGE